MLEGLMSSSVSHIILGLCGFYKNSQMAVKNKMLTTILEALEGLD